MIRRVARSARNAAYPAGSGTLSWVNWYGCSSTVKTTWPYRASSKCSLTTRVSGNVAIMPSTDSKAAGSRVDAVAGSSTGVADGSGLPLEIGVIDRPAPGRASIWVIPKNSVATPCTWTRSPTAIAAGQPPRQITKSPSEVAAESSTSPSSSCRKNPSSASWFVNVL